MAHDFISTYFQFELITVNTNTCNFTVAAGKPGADAVCHRQLVAGHRHHGRRVRMRHNGRHRHLMVKSVLVCVYPWCAPNTGSSSTTNTLWVRRAEKV